MQFNGSKYAGVFFWAFCAVCMVPLLYGVANAQSTDIEFPTAITENQVTGVIKARDIGDPRVTNFYYTFNGLQGDLFVNVVTKNLSGSVDVFLSDGMRPLSNIIVYADVAQSETGRVIYLRKPEKLILRVQGRTPNDDPAEFQIKFAGGFEAATPSKEEPPIPKVTGVTDNKSGVRVNSVGTIVAVIPKPKSTPKAAPIEVAKADQKIEEAKPAEEKPSTSLAVETKPEEKPQENTEARSAEPETKEPLTEQPKIVPSKSKTPNRRSTKAKSNQTAAEVVPSETKPVTEPSDTEKKADAVDPETGSKPEVVVTDTMAKTNTPAKKETPQPKPNPLANVRLVILFKDGTKVERPMAEVFRFTADQSTLTVVGTNGRVSKFPILNVASVTIQ